MQHKERLAVLSLAAIMAFRMFGLFIILPVFSVHAQDFSDATPSLIGLALGIYGLTQALLQMPYGILSDRIGRKPLIALGLLLFALGSLIAASAHSIYGLIIGRAMQGAGAIGSTTLALLADLTRDEQRSQAMAIMGVTIGLSFMLAMIVGPIVNAWLQLNGLFWLTALLAGIGIMLLYGAVPQAPQLVFDHTVETDAHQLRQVMRHPQLQRLNLSIACLHAILTALFMGVPILFSQLSISEHAQMTMYVIVLSGSFLVVMPLIGLAEKKRRIKPVMQAAIAALGIAALCLQTVAHTRLELGAVLLLFFIGFTFLEATLPSLVSKIAPLRSKGTAMGVYSTSQFFGIFVGGTLGGIIMQYFGLSGIFLLCLLLASAWLTVALTMPRPPYLSTLTLNLPQEASNPASLLHQLRQLPGVADSALLADEQLLYVKVDKKIISETELREWLQQCKVSVS